MSRKLLIRAALSAALTFGVFLALGVNNSAAPAFAKDGNRDRDERAAVITANDNCEPASFNAVLGAGACKGHGTTTLQVFGTEFAATGAVAAWNFSPSMIKLD